MSDPDQERDRAAIQAEVVAIIIVVLVTASLRGLACVLLGWCG